MVKGVGNLGSVLSAEARGFEPHSPHFLFFVAAIYLEANRDLYVEFVLSLR